MKKIAILTYNHAALFELGCAVELFSLPRPEFKNWYDAEVVCFDAGPHHATGGLLLSAKQVSSLRDYDMLVVPSWPIMVTEVKGIMADQIRQFERDGKRILSFCSGAFLLGALGLLDGQKTTTHWRYTQKFKQRFPHVDYVDNVLYVYNGRLGCSAGSAAAIDLGLEVIRGDYGHRIANQVARRLVLSAHRRGGQSQFVETPILNAPNQFAETLDWAIANLQHAFTIDTLAARANMSRRSFDRKFHNSFNLTPKQWLTQQKLDIAKDLLERDHRNIERIATQAGFDNATTMRHNFRKVLGLSPRQYRDQFAVT